jgi:DNA repair exonuclease SbcCD ATPase subunit
MIDTNELDVVEAEWTKVPDVTVDESPETALAVRAHSLFQEKIVLAIDIKKRAQELNLVNGDGKPVPVTHENYDQAKIIKAMCVKGRGDIKRLKEMANRNAIDWQRAVNKRAAELTEEIEPFEEPFAAGIKAIDNAEKAAKQARADAERKAVEDAERAKLEAERAAEDAKRAAERKQLEIDRAALEDERAKHRAAQEKIDEERREFEARKAASEKIERDRAAAAELERQRLEAAEADRRRLEAIKPDVEKIRALGAAIEQIVCPTVTSDEAKAVIERTKFDLQSLANDLKDFGE